LRKIRVANIPLRHLYYIRNSIKLDLRKYFCLLKKVDIISADVIMSCAEIMRSNMNKIVFILVLFIAIQTITSCKSFKTDDSSINVVVSILPQKAFVEAVGGNLMKVSVLIPPGGSPATYEPKPGDLARLEQADIYFRIGHIQFEHSHAARFSQLNPDMKIIDTSTNADLRYFGEHEDHHHGEEADHHDEQDRLVDPHIWLSPLEVKKQIEIMARSLSTEDPENQVIYNKNAEVYIKRLEELDAELRTLFSDLQSDKLLVFHPAWGYFAREYGLEQIAIEDFGKEPTAEHLKKVIDLAAKEEIRVIFIQSQFNAGIAQSIASEIGAVVISIDPLAEDYITNLRKAAAKISENLRSSG
jgi:zinc transport system substrate-binding protein